MYKRLIKENFKLEIKNKKFKDINQILEKMLILK